MIQPTIITIQVRGVPAGQPRVKARAFKPKFGKVKARVYTPNTADGWKNEIYLAAVGKRPAQPHDGPVRVDWACYFSRTNELEHPSVPDEAIPHCVMPDRDNVEKAILDALTEAGYWKNDSRVYAGTVGKWYVARGHKPGARIVITLEPDVHSRKARAAARAAAKQKELFPHA